MLDQKNVQTVTAGYTVLTAIKVFNIVIYVLIFRAEHERMWYLFFCFTFLNYNLP